MKNRTPGVRLPIQRKLFLFFLFAIILPLLLFGSFLFSQQMNVLENEVQQAAQRELVQMAERLNLEFAQVQAVSNLFYLDEEITRLLEGFEAKTLPEDEVQQLLQQRMNHYSTGLNNLRFQAAVIAPGGRVWGGTGSKPLYLQPAQIAWYARLQKRTTDILWVADEGAQAVFSTPGYPYICLVRQLHNRTTWEPVGTLVLGISELDILKMYYGYVGWDQSCYIVNRSDALVSRVDNLNGSLLGTLSPEEYASFSGSFIKKVGGARYLVNYYTISSTQWKIVTFSSLSSRLHNFAGVLTAYFTILALYLVITVVLSGLMARQFAKPITNLYSSIQKV
ncbi:MAG: cache domain-containing protein, partial [Oscillospiraceae bacterium]